MAFDRIVLVTRQTDLEALVERFQTQSQAEFYLKQAGQAFEPIVVRNQHYLQALGAVKASLPSDIKVHQIERRDLTTYRFDEKDVVIALGQDGLVANIAKYLDAQPLIAVNPDPENIDGILLPTQVQSFRSTLHRTLTEAAEVKSITMAEANTSDGQRLRAINDIFIGAQSHVSVRYRIEIQNRSEEQSSSGVIISTGVGSTGWLKSIYAGAIGIAHAIDPSVQIKPPKPLPWDAKQLVFNVREPWPSMNTTTECVSGAIARNQQLKLVSRMPMGGVIFGDGMESDYLEFNSGVTASVGVLRQALTLVMR